MEPWIICIPVVADLNHFDEEQIRIRIRIKVESQIRIRIKKAGSGSGSASRIGKCPPATKNKKEYNRRKIGRLR
jgi:hypothetical protein